MKKLFFFLPVLLLAACRPAVDPSRTVSRWRDTALADWAKRWALLK